MPGFFNFLRVRFFRIYSDRLLCSVRQAGRRISAYYRRTHARRLLAQSLSSLFLACAALALMGTDSCSTNQEAELEFVNTMTAVHNIFPIHIVPGAKRAVSAAVALHSQLVGTDGSHTGTAGFQGNFTAIQGPPQGVFLLAREADCSLGLVTVASGTDPGTITQHYEQTLHQLASLETTANVFSKGCIETSSGVSSRPGMFIGATTSGVLVFAAAGANGGNNALFIFNSNNDLTKIVDTSVPAATALATSDLNGDGNNDLLVVNGFNATSASVSVMLGNSDGSFRSPVNYPTAGDFSVAAVIEDVNGDGKPDIIVVSADSASATGQQISVLLGNGNGTFQSAHSFAAPALPGAANPASTPIVNLITADVNGDGKKDVVGSNGLVMLGNGDGTFTPKSTAAFPFIQATSNEGPNLASGDLNNDGKLDLVVNSGSTISTWIGKGDGTFTKGVSYASINDTGFVTVTDLDGDGNADIYVGLANGGIFSGDDSNPTSAYFLMGNGDGTFHGAPVTIAYSGNNLVDINGDGVPDLVSNSSSQTSGVSAVFTVALGTDKGTFTQASTVTAPNTFTINGFNFTGVSAVAATSYAVADVDGDGHADLVFVDNSLTAINPGSGLPITYPYPVYFVALGDGDGTFAVPVPHAFPQIAPASGFDNTLNVTGLQIADFNKDGHNDLIFTYNDQAGGTGVNPFLQGLVVLTGVGNGTFSTTPALTSTYSSTSAPATAKLEQVTNIADLDGDGIPDLVVLVPSFSIAQGATTQLNVFVGNGDGTFKSPTPVAISASAYGIPVLLDFNKDGKSDIAFLAETSSSQAELAVALGNGDGTFANATTSNLSGGDAIRSSGLAGADFDGDGDIDLALLDNADFSGIFYGKGDGTFTSVPVAGNIVPKDLINLSVSSPAVAIDLNNDGKPDIFAGNVALVNSPAPRVTTPAATTTTLTASATTLSAGSSITLTATVAETAGSATPSGTVTFLDGTASLGTGTLASGSATFSTSSLSVGTHSITASYAGDSGNAASTSSAMGIVVTAVGSGDFSMALNPTSGTVNGGSSVTSTLTITPSGGFNQQVSFTCSGLPKNASCSFSPASVTLDGTNPATSTLTIKTDAASAALFSPSKPSQHSRSGGATALAFLGGGGLLALTLLSRQGNKRQWYVQFGLALVIGAAFVTAGCGGSGSKVTTSQVTITGTAGTTSHAATYSLTVK